MEDSPVRLAENHVGSDLLGALLDEIKALPDSWQAMAEYQQAEVIDRVKARVEHAVASAVNIIAADGRLAIPADLVEVKFKDGVEGKLKLPKSTPHVLELAENAGQPVLLVIASAEPYVGGMDEIEADADQPDLVDGGEADPLYDAAVAYVIESQRASISSVQRKMQVGYNRAARMIETMERNGVVSAAGHDGSRQVIGGAS